MADRLTVVFDDAELYRRLKVRAAEEGVAMKRIIEDAVAAYLGSAETGSPPARFAPALDWEAWDELQAQLDAIDEEPSPDASDIKHQLYGAPRRRLTPRGWALIAEDQAEYDVGPPRG
jgi:hypothetical protein